MYNSSVENPEDFWGSRVDSLDWYTRPRQVLDRSNPPFYRWFPDGQLSLSYNCLDRHLPALGSKPAFIYEGNIAKESKQITYEELHRQVELLCGVLRQIGVGRGDRAIIYMPMILEAPVAMLAVSRIGAVHSVVFGGFSAKELASRIVDSEAKVILSASCGLEPHKIVDFVSLVREAKKLVGRESLPVLFVNRPQKPLENLMPSEHDYRKVLDEFAPKYEGLPLLKPQINSSGRSRSRDQAAELRNAQKYFARSKFMEVMRSTDPLYILYTSGTTGTPKGIYRDIGGTAIGVHLSMQLGFGFERGSVIFSTSDIGWVVGHSYIVYGPLLFGATSVMYEGKPVGTPDCTAYFRIVEKHKATILYTSPTAVRSIMREDPEGAKIKTCNLSSLQVVGVVGERTDINTYNFLKKIAPEKCLYNDTYWQTETGWFICANFRTPETFPTKGGSCTKPYPGYKVEILDEEGAAVPDLTLGYVHIKLPMPPGFMTSLWKNDEFFVKKYLDHKKGYYYTGDLGFRDNDHYIHIMTRCDDVINVAGHRISVYQMEEAIMKHKDVAEAVVVGIKEALKGQVPFGMVVLKTGRERTNEDLKKEITAIIRDEIGPIATPYGIAVVAAIPKTRSGKVLRGTIKKILDKEEYKCPETIDDIRTLDAIKVIEETLLNKREEITYDTSIIHIEDKKVKQE